MGLSVSFRSNRGKAKQIETTYQNAILKCAKVVRFYSNQVGGLSGFTAHDKTYQYGGLEVNGSKRVGVGDTFSMREHYSQNESFYIETYGCPYDTVVKACLIILKHFLKSQIEIDAESFRHEWIDGLMLARQVTQIKTLSIPDSIQDKPHRAA